ncbi:hypothetical protein Tdes44962_MAKER08261 [Teratosphaeria destructans]|uniref:Uncharacterized protein n=1 Tax=Teratosphaeria destructans TaxID=418781 RepID=A0A9W7W4W7_9PEZI|nr:hypothetical protein Tdes44962_MAKER08261 [Teratosphaeria destructans]
MPPHGQDEQTAAANEAKAFALMRQSKAAHKRAEEYEQQADMAQLISAYYKAGGKFLVTEIILLSPHAVHAHLHILTSETYTTLLHTLRTALFAHNKVLAQSDWPGVFQQYRTLLDVFPAMREEKLRLMAGVIRVVPLFEGDLGECVEEFRRAAEGGMTGEGLYKWRMLEGLRRVES